MADKNKTREEIIESIQNESNERMKYAQKRERVLTKRLTEPRILCSISKVKIDEITFLHNYLQYYQKIRPFITYVFDQIIEFCDHTKYRDESYAITLSNNHISSEYAFGWLEVHFMNSTEVMVDIWYAGDKLTEITDLQKLQLFYREVIDYLTELGRNLRNDYQGGFVENRLTLRPGRKTFEGQNEVAEKIAKGEMSKEEAYRYWKTHYPDEFSNSYNPVKAFEHAMTVKVPLYRNTKSIS